MIVPRRIFEHTRIHLVVSSSPQVGVDVRFPSVKWSSDHDARATPKSYRSRWYVVLHDAQSATSASAYTELSELLLVSTEMIYRFNNKAAYRRERAKRRHLYGDVWARHKQAVYTDVSIFYLYIIHLRHHIITARNDIDSVAVSGASVDASQQSWHPTETLLLRDTYVRCCVHDTYVVLGLRSSHWINDATIK